MKGAKIGKLALMEQVEMYPEEKIASAAKKESKACIIFWIIDLPN